MSTDPWQGGELDAALDDIEEAPEKPAGPPALPPRSVAEYNGRTPFPDLFVLDKEPTAGLRGGPDEKIEYFRRALKKAETAINRFRDAWVVREREMDSLEALSERESERSTKRGERLEALEKFVGEKRSEFDEYGKRIAEAFAEKEQIEKELRDAKKETEEQLAREQSEREQMAADLVEARKEHDCTLQREREEHANALGEENQAQEQEMRDAKREHEARMRDERQQLDTMVQEEREQHEAALSAERKKFRENARTQSEQHAEELKGHADDKAAVEFELAQVQLALQEKELLEDELRAQLKKLTSGERDSVAELHAQLEEKAQELTAGRDALEKARREAANNESELYDRIEVLQDNLRTAREAVTDAERRATVDRDQRDGSIRELSSSLELERRALRDAELMHREQSVEFPAPAITSALDPDEQAKLQRAVTFSLKVVGSLLAGSIDEANREEVMKRARIALGVARDLVDKL